MSQLGIVTYNIAKDWDLPTILSRLEKLGYEGVELRTTHAHKVEVNLSKQERDEVRKRFEDSPVELAGLGSAFEYQAADAAIVRKNIDGTKEYVRLAHDVGAPGVKVRPNGVARGADLDATLCTKSEKTRPISASPSAWKCTAESLPSWRTSPRSCSTQIIRMSTLAGIPIHPT
jgi:sugar phosphate isomerase/epimerase